MDSTAKSNKIKLISIALLVLILLVSAVVAGYFLIYRKSPTTNNTNPTSKVTPTPDPYATWETYRNTGLNISFKYPSNWTVTDKSIDDCNAINLSEKGGARLDIMIADLKTDSCYPVGNGAGEFTTNGTIKILDKEATKSEFIYNEKVIQVIYTLDGPIKIDDNSGIYIILNGDVDFISSVSKEIGQDIRLEADKILGTIKKI
jgi:hypothetical protein